MIANHNQGMYPTNGTAAVVADPGPIGQNPPFKKILTNESQPGLSQTTSSAAPSSTSSKTTPISMLQELCQKLNKTPRYDLLTMEGRAHQPSFVFRLVFLSKSWPKIEILVTDQNSVKKWKLRSNIKILLKNKNLDKKSKLWPKIKI